MTNGKLAVLVPSRGRPKKFYTFLESYLACRSEGTSDLILRTAETDESDYSVFDGIRHVIHYVGSDEGYEDSVSGTIGYCPAQQEMWTKFPDYSAYLCTEDDTVIHTPGFDRWILDTLDELPGRIGVVQMHDRAGQINVLAMSAEWCRALGHLYDPEVGENAFEQTIFLANDLGVLIQAGENAAFTHYPLLREYGYKGDERAGALARPDVVSRFRKEETFLFSHWLPENHMRVRGKLLAAIKKGSV